MGGWMEGAASRPHEGVVVIPPVTTRWCCFSGYSVFSFLMFLSVFGGCWFPLVLLHSSSSVTGKVMVLPGRPVKAPPPAGSGPVLVLTCLCGFPPGLLDVLLVFVAEFNLQLLRLHLQVLLPVCQSFTGLQQDRNREERRLLQNLCEESGFIDEMI